jgi:hypothetical protein
LQKTWQKGYKVYFTTDSKQEEFEIEAVSEFEIMVRIDGVWYWTDNIKESKNGV